VAVRSSSKKRKTPEKLKTGALWALFWVAFLILIAGLFLASRDRIRKTLEDTRAVERVLNRPPAEPAAAPAPALKPSTLVEPVPVLEPVPAAEPAALPAAPPRAAPAAAVEPAPAPAGRERLVYFVRISEEGEILRTAVNRRIPPSDSPLLDTLQSLLQGPSADEQRRGIRSLIPPGTRVLSVTVQEGTASISLSEDFQYAGQNGKEGYEAQMRQIVWTATEFPTVKNVLFLIEGRRLDYLNDWVRIDRPIGRNSL
jgi:hypothetical protein